MSFLCSSRLSALVLSNYQGCFYFLISSGVICLSLNLYGVSLFRNLTVEIICL